MPVGKQLGKFDGKFNSIRIVEVNDDNTRILEGSYSAAVTGDLAGTAKGTMTFDGAAERGVADFVETWISGSSLVEGPEKEP